jgi:CRISPR-associated protein Cmr4
MANRVYWLHTLTPTHAGIGRGIGYIDLPIDRDAVTNWPLIRGSAFKGVLADHYRATRENRERELVLRAAFGLSSDAADNAANSGSLIPTDARLVCLPVRSFRGTFAWCTSALALQMLHRTLGLSGMKLDGLKVPDAPPDTPAEAFLADAQGLVENGRVYLEDLDFKAAQKNDVTAWAAKIADWVFPDPAEEGWRNSFKKRFAVLPDVVFDFLCETGTEVNTRVRISDETKTVAVGALWTEESLPAESILCGVVACDRVFGKDGKEVATGDLLERYATNPLNLQIGGKATVGRGQVRCVFTKTEGGGK